MYTIQAGTRTTVPATLWGKISVPAGTGNIKRTSRFGLRNLNKTKSRLKVGHPAYNFDQCLPVFDLFLLENSRDMKFDGPF